MKPPELTDAELLFLEAIGASEDGDPARARDLLRLARTLSGDDLLFGPASPAAAAEAATGAFPPRRTPGALATPDDVDDAELMVQDAIDAANAGNLARARDLLSRGLILDEGNVRGWLWLSGMVQEPQDRAFCLRRVLELDPGHELAREALAWLPQQRDREPVPEPPAVHDLPGEQAAPQEQAPHLDRPGAVETVLHEPASGRRPAETGVETVYGEGAPQAGLEPRGGVGVFLRSEFALIVLLGLVLLVLIASANLVGEAGLPLPLSLLRVLLGLAFVLFVPGYALQAALFPRKDALDGPVRLALSFGLSVALVPPLVLILDRLPWGIHLGPIVAAEGLVTILLSEAALLRRWRLPANERPVFAFELVLKGWWAAQDRAGRVLYGVLAGALLLALIAAVAILLSPLQGRQFTEFYILGSEGPAENYPRQAAPGEPLSVTVGIANREGQAIKYWVEVLVDGESLGGTDRLTLTDGQVWQAELVFTLLGAGDDQRVEILLYRDGLPEPYRRLQWRIDVVEVTGGGAD